MPVIKLGKNEPHFTASESVRDVVIGMSDGLTVPFALAAGLTGAIAASHLIIIAGFAEIAAGSISMGLGGYLAAKGDVEHYQQERKNEESEVVEIPDREAEEVREIFEVYGLTAKQVEPILKNFRANPKLWVDFMMTNELGLEEPDPNRVVLSAITIASAYIIGGVVPLIPYFFVHNSHHALWPSVFMTLTALFLFGFFKARIAGSSAIKSAFQTVIIGGIAAGVAFTLARLIA
jgi:predicted membrane protein (TIGR00267 family)